MAGGGAGGQGDRLAGEQRVSAFPTFSLAGRLSYRQAVEARAVGAGHNQRRIGDH
jgi:hypothetical protein